MDKEITGRLEGWTYDPIFNIIWGFVYDDIRKRFRDETWIHTSNIVSKSKKFRKGQKVKTLNSIYLLGKKYEPPKNKLSLNISRFP